MLKYQSADKYGFKAMKNGDYIDFDFSRKDIECVRQNAYYHRKCGHKLVIRTLLVEKSGCPIKVVRVSKQ